MNCQEITTRIKEIKTKKADFDNIFKTDIPKALILKKEFQNLIEILKVEFRGEISKETLQRSQKVYDFIFGVGTYNLQELYDSGQIISLSKYQQETIEAQEENEKYALELVMPRGIDRDEFLTAFTARYASEFSSEGVKNWAKEDIDKTNAVTNPDRPTTFYTVALRPQGEVNEAHPETKEKTPEQAETILKTQQTANSNLNLKGLTLPESLFLDAHHFTETGKHLDESHWSYLLGEKVTGTARTLDAGWRSGDRRVAIASHSVALSVGGSRFVVVAK